MSLLAVTADVTRTRAELDQIQAQVAELAQVRRNLMQDAADHVRRQGFEACVIRNAPERARTEGIEALVVEHFSRWDGAGTRHTISAWAQNPEMVQQGDGSPDGIRFRFDETGGRSYTTLSIHHGNFRVVLVDGDDILVTRPDVVETESAHRHSVNRLRTLARREELRVKVRDHDVSIVDPLDSVVHQGTVLTGFGFIANIDLNTEVSA